MLTLTAEQVRTLAPDASAARAGEGLADPGRWSDIGRAEAAAWGLCQGSGSSPYQAIVDLEGPAYRCSCPSRKIPCKHALGLLFLLADGAIGQAEPPDWVTAWLESRATRAAAAATRTEQAADVDPAARTKRIASREKKVAAGIDELDRWLADLVRRGFDSARAEGYRFWDAMGARLVDAQAGGLGRSVRALGSAASAGDAWPHFLLEGAARLHLLCEAYRRIDQLPEPLRADVRVLVGWTTKEEDLDPTDSVEDRWLVVGRRVDDTGQVITTRTFLLGEASRRFALHLAFGVGPAPPTALAMPGQAIRATLTFYPSASPLRAAVRPVLVPDGEVTAIPGSVGIADVVRRHAERLGLNPFLDRSPVAVGPVVAVVRGGSLLVREESGATLPVAPASVAPWLLAVSGGHPVTVIGEWDGSWLRAISVLADARLVALEAPLGNPAIARDGDGSWSKLVSAALLGTERAGEAVAFPEAASGLVSDTGRDRERSLLAAAGVLALRRRAGRQPDADGEPLPAPAPDDSRPALAGEAARLVGLVATEQGALLPEVLGLVRSSRRRIPDEWLPELLTLAAGDPTVGRQVVELGGARSAWLSALVPSLAGGAARAVESDWDAAWETAHGAKQRAALVSSMRRADPVAAREAFARWLPEVAGDERAAMIGALETGLDRDDESVLSPALGDRRLDVRRAAADLLARIDGAAFAGLIEARARPLLATHGRLRPSLTVTLPTLDAELESAGVGGRPPAGLGERAWLLRQLLAHVRPSRWQEWLSADASALVARALRSDEARPVLEGWAEAAARFADGDWLAALVAEPNVAATVRLDLRAMVAALPDAPRASLVARVAHTVDAASLAWLAARCPPVWPEALADAVIATLRDLPGTQYPDQPLYDLLRAAAVGLAPERADELAALASYEGQIRPALTAAVETVRLRRRIHAAFADLPPVQ